MRAAVICFGALIVQADSTAPVRIPTYRADVAVILERHCTSCHISGGVGRIPLDTFERAHAFAPEIRESASFRKMPPSLAVPGFGHFSNDVPLTLSEIDTLIRWADTGAQQGDGPGNFGAKRTARESLSAAEKIILQPETAYNVPTVPGLHRRCFSYPSPVREPTAIRAVDVVPSDGRVVYYVRVFVNVREVASGVNSTHDCSEQMQTAETRISLGEWGPDWPPEPLSPGTGRLLMPNSTITVEICYQSIGLRVRDRSRIELLVQPATKFVRTRPVLNKMLDIPAGEWDFRAETNWIVDHDLTLLSVSPHMHKLGTEMRVQLTRPDGTKEDILWIRGYDEKLQKAYVFREPVRVPKDSRMDVIASFDNSQSNTNNPNTPARAVGWGSLDHDEMMIAFIEYLDGLQ